MAQPLTAAAGKAAADRLREQMRRQHIALAQQARRDVEAQQGASPTLTVVDGARGRVEEGVKLGGSIVYLFDATPRAHADLMEHLNWISPVDTSDDADDRVFAKSFVALIEGMEAEIAALKPGDEVTVANRQPYSRKLELGWSLQAPDGVFEVAAKWLRSRWGKAVDVRFTYVALEGMPGVKKQGYRGNSTRYPAIILKSKVI